MRKLIWLILATFLYFTGTSQSFIKTKGTEFIQHGKVYNYLGTNYWYGGYLKFEEHGINRLRKELDFLKSNGVTNLRLVAGAEGRGKINGIERIGPALQPEQGVFNISSLRGLDLLLDEMSKRNMKAVIFLSNNWEWSGGFLQYLNWNNLLPDSIMRRQLNWDENRDLTSKFYSCEACIKAYYKQARLVIGRKNSVNGRRYKNDPTIMAWELANEPRPMRPSANDAYLEWIDEASAFIKSLDKTHLVTTGHEGEIGTQSLELFSKAHQFKNIDYLTIHIWPKNWAWFSDTSIHRDFDSILSKTKVYIEKHIDISMKLNKPLVIEEFGLPRDGHRFERNSSTNLRDRYYEYIMGYFRSSNRLNQKVAGVNFWAFGGFALNRRADHCWKPGDPYTGDPPMEEQGLNSVFPADSSTWRMIRSFAK